MINILQKPIFIVLALIFCSIKTFAQSSTKEITGKFFGLYLNDPTKAVEYAFSTNKWTSRKQDDVTSLKNKLKDLVSILGNYYGYELLSEKTAGQRIKMETYVIFYDREPIRFTFYFYKPKDIWQLNSFSYDEDIDKDLEEATKAYRLKENISY